MEETAEQGSGLAVAVVGAGGLVGAEVLRLLAERGVPVQRVVAVGLEASLGLEVELGDIATRVVPLTPEALRGCQVVVGAAPPDVVLRAAAMAGDAPALFIDLSGAFSDDPHAPVVVCDVNDEVLDEPVRRVLSPAGPVGPLALYLHAVRALAPLERVVVTLFVPASHHGRSAMEELGSQTIALLNQTEVPLGHFPERLAFNLIPLVGGVKPGTPFSMLEDRVASELRRALDEPRLTIDVTAVQVPLFSGQAASVVVDFARPVQVDRLRAELSSAEGIDVRDNPEDGQLPLAGAVSEVDDVQVGRLRQGEGRDRTVQAWIASDNLRRGSALNAVQVIELALAAGWLSR